MDDFLWTSIPNGFVFAVFILLVPSDICFILEPQPKEYLSE
jgi:hypothetical protein